MKSLAAATAVLLLTALNGVAFAQVVYQPVRYQYGQYNEVFYGGRDPAIAGNPYVYVPWNLQAAYATQRQGYGTFTPYQPYGPNTAFFSPYSQSTSRGSVPPLIFSDYFPHQEVGQFGYTIDDARNEAYFNMPRIVYGGNAQAATAAPAPAATEAPAPEPAPAAQPVTDPRVKALPLINWAKAERTKNPELYNAILVEARKFDPAAVDALLKEYENQK